MPSASAIDSTEVSSAGVDEFSAILQGIQEHLSSVELNVRLNRVPAARIMAWKDKATFNLIHHCILENNAMVFLMLLARGYFRSPRIQGTMPYLHLAACLGRTAFITLIIQEISYQNNAIVLDWKVFKNVIQPRVKSCPELKPIIKARKLSPIDVAAYFGHINCVKRLLDFWRINRPVPRGLGSLSPESLYVLLAFQANSPQALQLFEDSNWKEALEYSLSVMNLKFVDMILSAGHMTDIKKAFHGMNLYHVMYSYSSCFSMQQYASMKDITSILIKHKQDVNAWQPLRTFPLYSLLCHKITKDGIRYCHSHFLACLRRLLEAGTDPNFDEIQMEERVKYSEMIAYERQPHSSAINCFLASLPSLKLNNLEDSYLSDFVDKYACEALVLLLQYGADLTFFGKFQKPGSSYAPNAESSYFCGTPLHLFLSTRSQSTLSFPLLRLMMPHGIDADSLGSWNMPGSKFTFKYAINILPFSLWSRSLRKLVHPNVNISSKDIEMLMHIMNFMSQNALVQAYKEFLDGADTLRVLARRMGKEAQMVKDNLHGSLYFTQILSAYEHVVKQPWSLQRCCSQVVWKACRMHVSNIHALSIPGPLKNVILSGH